MSNVHKQSEQVASEKLLTVLKLSDYDETFPTNFRNLHKPFTRFKKKTKKRLHI